MNRTLAMLTHEYAVNLLRAHGHEQEANCLTLECVREAAFRRAKAVARGMPPALMIYLLEVVREQGS